MVLFGRDEVGFVNVYEIGIEAHADSVNNLEEIWWWLNTKGWKVFLSSEPLTVACIKYPATPSTFTSVFYEAAKPHALDCKCMNDVLRDENIPSGHCRKHDLTSSLLQLKLSDLHFLPGVCWWNGDHCGSPGPHPTDRVHSQSLLSGGRGEQRASSRDWDHTYVVFLACHYKLNGVRHRESKTNDISICFEKHFALQCQQRFFFFILVLFIGSLRLFLGLNNEPQRTAKGWLL